MAKKNRQRTTKKSHKSGKGIWGFLLILVVAVAAIACWIDPLDLIHPDSLPVKTVTESELLKVVKKSKLYTAEYPYNSYVEVKDENDKIKYYVAYNGTIKAGFDVKDVKVDMNDDENVITIQLPEIKILKADIDVGSMDYIFENQKYNTETVSNEAMKKATEDLRNKAAADSSIISVATDNAKRIEKAVVEPWVNQANSDKKYTVQVLAYGEEQ